MPHALFVPRVNNNDDEVRVVKLSVQVGEQVAHGQVVAEVETEKAVVAVECDQPGYVLQIAAEEGTSADVGAVLIWLGETSDEQIPAAGSGDPKQTDSREPLPPTAKARKLIAEHGLDPRDISRSGERVTVADVEAFLENQPSSSVQPQARVTPPAMLPSAEGSLSPLSISERGMMRSVLWHRDEAVPAYLQTEYDVEAWQQHARQFKAEHRMLADPLIPLMAFRLSCVVADHARANSTIVDEQRFVYDSVNIGLTIQFEDTLYLVTIRDAARMQPKQFVDEFGKLHRRALTRKLDAADVSGATVGFSSMARWQVDQHIPILPPYASLMVAHTITRQGRGILGAAYDHRVLAGADTIDVLSQLSVPHD